MPRGRPRREVAEVKEDAEVEKNDHEDDVEKVSKSNVSSKRGKKQKVVSKENVSNIKSEDPPVKKKKTVGSGTVSKITIEHCTS